MTNLSNFQGLTTNYTISLDCGNYQIKRLSSFGLSQTIDIDELNKANCYNNSFTDNMKLISTCSLTTYFSDYFNSLCLNNEKCYFPFSGNDFNTNCKGYTTQNIVYFTYMCSNPTINSFGGMSKSLLSIIAITVDVVSMLILIILILL